MQQAFSEVPITTSLKSNNFSIFNVYAIVFQNIQYFINLLIYPLIQAFVYFPKLLVLWEHWGRPKTLMEDWKEFRRSALFMGFPGGSDGKESACNVGDLGSIPGLVRSPAGGHGNPLQYSCLENPRGQRSLAGYSLWGHKESDTTEWLTTAHSTHLKGGTQVLQLHRKEWTTQVWNRSSWAWKLK